MNIRDAKLADLPRIVAIYNATVPSRMVTADTEPVSVESRIAWFEAHKETRPLWVAEQGGALTGWLSLSTFYARPAYDKTVEISVYVAAGARRTGLATSLIEHAIAAAPNIGIATLVGFIFAHNTPSLKLFEKLKFERWGHLPRVTVLDGIERDVVIVGRRIP
jgi:L-amino acid N-acyltransferase YncA